MTRLIEPSVASAVAKRVAGRSESVDERDLETLRTHLEISVPRSEELVATVSGIAPPAPVRWGILERSAWAEANIAGMSSLIAPLADKLGQRLDSLPMPIRIAQRGVVSVEIGAMLGYISRRVLGQYDLLVPENPDRTTSRRLRRATGDASLYFVGANMVETQKKLHFVPEDFALWVAVHEVTHRFQFAGVPW
ncbi:MAG: zinc-dependent metalloprotease, partial [Actinobacteria bacterium]|nr:zinc-dependent metalloprotease [Actinomycetota bacterium]